MRSPTLILAVPLLLAACGGGGAAGAARVPDLDRYSSSRLASPELCERAITNYERRDFASTTTPVSRKGLFHRTQFELEHRRRVDKCTISVSERHAACVAWAPSLQYIRNCESFAELQ